MEEKKQSFEEWYRKERKSTKGTEFQIRGSIGVYDIYKHIRKNKWYDIGRPVKEHEFYSIIRGINALMAEELSKGNSIVFPWKMGSLELRKHQVGVRMVDGKLENTYPIDWPSTLHLWHEDEEAYKDKVLLRNEVPWLYYIGYRKRFATYENKKFYQFYPNTFLRKKLSRNLKQGKAETYLKY